MPIRQPSTGGKEENREALTKGGRGARAQNGQDDAWSERLACIQVPALPLQLLVQRHPEWEGRPVAVVDEDRPQGTILWVNEGAYRRKVLPGMRYAGGLSLCDDLCAGEVAEAEVEAGVERLTELLWRFSPEVEPSADEPGVFWVDASGLGRLVGSLGRWARRIRRELGEEEFVARVAVGFGRFGTYALARTSRAVTVLHDRERERELTAKVRLDRLQIDPGLRDSLARLGVHTVGRFLELPPEGLGKRFGPEAVELYRRARGDAEEPLDPVPHRAPVEARVELEYPEGDAHRLLFLVKRLLPLLLERLASMHQGLSELEIELILDTGGRSTSRVRTAEPTLDAPVILDLARLKLDGTDLTEGVIELVATARGTAIDDEQLALFLDRPKRDLAAANRALARLRAEYGDDAVVWARPREGHLPEATFVWEPLEEMRFPRVGEEGRNAGDDGSRGREGGFDGSRVGEGLHDGSKAGEGRDGEGGNGETRGGRSGVGTGASGAAGGGDEDAHAGDRRASAWRGGQKIVPFPTGTGDGDDEPSRGLSSTRPDASLSGSPRDAGSSAESPDAGLPERTLIRRLYQPPRQLPARERREPDGWLVRGLERGPAVRVRGPYVVSGGWWVREVHREYYFVETQRGDVLWVYYDRNRRRWMLHGQVE